METDRLQIKNQEIDHLEREKALYPDLFPEVSTVDDSAILEKFGIHIPNKDNLPKAYLKLRPSDFIVEEIGKDKKIQAVDTALSPNISVEGGTTYATLIKCGLSTLEAVEELAKLLGASKDQIRYAGIKDKDAFTAQQISFRGISVASIATISSPYFMLKDIYIGKGVMEKGGLYGNKFSIFLRTTSDIRNTPQETSLQQSLETVKEKGFYNFFYLQRFGNPRLNSYRLGINILKSHYKMAVEDYLTEPGLRENPYFRNIRANIKTHIADSKKVIEILGVFPIIFANELKLVTYLAAHPEDYIGALRQIEDQVTLWVHSVSSILHNRKLSSYLMAGIEPPQALPQFLSPDKNDWLEFAEDLEQIGIFPPDLNAVRPFRNIILQKKMISTKDRADIHAMEITEQGIALSFSLQKGEYATTFLSHFVNLIGGYVPENISDDIVDTKEILGFSPITSILEKFSELNISKKK